MEILRRRRSAYFVLPRNHRLLKKVLVTDQQPKLLVGR